MIRLALALIVVMLAMGVAGAGGTKPAPDPVSFEIHHNVPPIVEQQYVFTGCMGSWTDLTNCTTNASNCAWDVDDYLRLARGTEGSASTCTFADGAARQWSLTGYEGRLGATHHKPFTASITFTSKYQSDTFEIGSVDGKALMCVNGPYYPRVLFETIPYQGGGGGALGLAVPTDVTINISGESRRLGVGLETWLSRASYDGVNWFGCPVGVPRETVTVGQAYYFVARSE